MAITFDTEEGIVVEDAATVRETVQAMFRNAFLKNGVSTLNVDSESPAGQLIDSLTALIVQKDADLLFLAQQFNPATAEGRWQKALAEIYFLEPKEAESTVVQCQCMGLMGTVIPTGAVVQNDDGYQMASLESATIPSEGTIDVSFALTETGAIAIAAGTVNKIITVIPGWDTVSNEEPGVVGRDAETRAELEARRYASVAANAHGSIESILGTLNQIDGVLDCVVLENTTSASQTIDGVEVDAHSIAVCIYGGEDTDIAEAIYTKKDAGCGTSGNTEVTYTAEDYGNTEYVYQIYRPTVTSVKFTVTAVRLSGTTDTAAEDIQQAIYDDFYGNLDNDRVGMAQTIHASRFYPAVMSAADIGLETIKIALGDDDYVDSIEIDAATEPVLDIDDIEVTIYVAG